MEKNVWAVVIIVVSAMAAVTVTAVTGAGSADLLQVIATAVVPTVTIILVGRDVSSRVDKVQENVNGRMSELIGKVPEAERPETR